MPKNREPSEAEHDQQILGDILGDFNLKSQIQNQGEEFARYLITHQEMESVREERDDDFAAGINVPFQSKKMKEDAFSLHTPGGGRKFSSCL